MCFQYSFFFSLTLYLDGEDLEAELMEEEGEVTFTKKLLHHLLIFLEFSFVCLFQDNFQETFLLLVCIKTRLFYIHILG